MLEGVARTKCWWCARVFARRATGGAVEACHGCAPARHAHRPARGARRRPHRRPLARGRRSQRLRPAPRDPSAVGARSRPGRPRDAGARAAHRVRVLGRRPVVSAGRRARVRPRYGRRRDDLGTPPGVARRARRDRVAFASNGARSARSDARAVDGCSRGSRRLRRRVDVSVRVRAPAGDGLLPRAPWGVRRVSGESLTQQRASHALAPAGRRQAG